jgi:hypothetical protein
MLCCCRVHAVRLLTMSAALRAAKHLIATMQAAWASCPYSVAHVCLCLHRLHAAAPQAFVALLLPAQQMEHRPTLSGRSRPTASGPLQMGLVVCSRGHLSSWLVDPAVMLSAAPAASTAAARVSVVQALLHARACSQTGHAGAAEAACLHVQ